MSILRKLAGQTAVYGLSSVLGRMLNYLLVPLYTSVFAPGEYGVVTEFYAYVAFLNIFFIYGLETAYFRFSSQENGYNYFNLALTSILISSIAFAGVIFLFSEGIASTLDYPEKGNLIRWLALILAIDAIVAIPFARLRQEGKAYNFAVYKLSNIGINIFLNLFFLLACPAIIENNPDHFLSTIYNSDLGVGYVFLSNLIANALYILFFTRTWIKLKVTFNTAEWKRMMKYAWPVLIIGFAGVTNEMLSRAILKYRLPEGFYEGYSNLESLGIFGACYKLSVFMTLAVQAFRYAFEPFFFSQATDKNSPKLFAQIMYWFVIFTGFSWLAVSVFLPQIAPLFLRQDSYLEALNTVPWLLGGGLMLGVFYNLSLWYKLTDKTLYGAYISIVGAIVTFILNWSLIPIFGYMGSAIATFSTYSLMVLISFFWGRKHYPVPYEVWKIFGYILLVVGGILLNNYLVQSIISSIIILFSFCFLILLFNFRRIKAKKG